MAVAEVIRFPFSVQLDRGTTFPADAFRDPPLRDPGSPHILLYLFQARPDERRSHSQLEDSPHETPAFPANNRTQPLIRRTNCRPSKTGINPILSTRSHPARRSDVEIARVYANREFFDNFENIVEDDAKWAYRFQRKFE